LASAASLTFVSRQTVVSSSSFVINRPGCSTRCRRTANARGASVSRRAPHHAHSFSGSIRIAGGSSDRVRLMPLLGQSLEIAALRPALRQSGAATRQPGAAGDRTRGLLVFLAQGSLPLPTRGKI